MSKKLAVFLIILQCLSALFIYLHIEIHTKSNFQREYRDGNISGQIEMYSKMKKSGVVIPDSVKKPYREKHVEHFSEAPAFSFFLVPAAFCFILTLVVVLRLWCEVIIVI